MKHQTCATSAKQISDFIFLYSEMFFERCSGTQFIVDIIQIAKCYPNFQKISFDKEKKFQKSDAIYYSFNF